MKTELLKSIAPITEKYVEDLLAQQKELTRLEKELKEERITLETLVEQRDAEVLEARKIREAAQGEIDTRLSALATEKTLAEIAKKKYEQLCDEQRKLLDKTKKDEESLIVKHKVVDDKMQEVQSKLDSALKKEDKYEKLLKMIQKDLAELENKKMKADDEDKKLKEKHIDDDKRTKTLHELAITLSDQELELRARESDVQRLIRRYNLQEQIKENE